MSTCCICGMEMHESKMVFDEELEDGYCEDGYCENCYLAERSTE